MRIRKYQLVAAMIAVSVAVVAAAFARPETGSSPTRVSGTTLTKNGSSTSAPASTSAGGTTFSAAGTTISQWVKANYPQQAAAKQVSGDPATYRWALIIGLNDYAGSTASNVGSRQDAESLTTYLEKLHWRKDHILLIRDLQGSASHILQAMQWLASKTTSNSIVIFHYAGHENWTSANQGDGESRNVAIWAADNHLIYDGTVGKYLGKVRAKQMWIDFATCRAAGFNDAGMRKAGRIITYSSTANELSYEDADLHHSVFGWYSIVQGMVNKHADANKDGKVAVEEAYNYAKKRVPGYTSGRQHTVVSDDLSGYMYLTIPAKKKPSSSSKPAPSPSGQLCVFVCL
jgi:hypothetical protein